MVKIANAAFKIGQIIHHKLFDYRGVIIDIDPIFMLTDEWYDVMATSKPPKNKAWYHVLVDNALHQTYVSEKNIENSLDNTEINHPEVELYFDEYKNGEYIIKNYC
jgi:heat shock protein HspQ